MAASFDKLIQEIGSRYCIGPKACPLVQETLGSIIGGFLDRFKAAGFAAESNTSTQWCPYTKAGDVGVSSVAISTGASPALATKWQPFESAKAPTDAWGHRQRIC